MIGELIVIGLLIGFLGYFFGGKGAVNVIMSVVAGLVFCILIYFIFASIHKVFGPFIFG